MEHTANRCDEDLREAVEVALGAALDSQAPHLGVAADHGTVTLTGELLSEVDRDAAVTAARSVWGLHVVADDIVVSTSQSAGLSDTDIAQAASAALHCAEGVPRDGVLVEVAEHTVILGGAVSSYDEQLAAERAVSYVRWHHWERQSNHRHRPRIRIRALNGDACMTLSVSIFSLPYKVSVQTTHGEP
jgi:osmotically-inducible protein OsmY